MARRVPNSGRAGASTGPRTVEGKRRSSKNALKHGLAIRPWQDPSLATEVAELATGVMAVYGGDPVILPYAQAIAEAEIQLSRVTLVRSELIARILPSADPPAVNSANVPLSGTVANSLRSIALLDRYEQRALSRRKWAMRAILQELGAVRRNSR
jgi:hypothetical protein